LGAVDFRCNKQSFDCRGPVGPGHKGQESPCWSTTGGPKQAPSAAQGKIGGGHPGNIPVGTPGHPLRGNPKGALQGVVGLPIVGNPGVRPPRDAAKGKRGLSVGFNNQHGAPVKPGRQGKAVLGPKAQTRRGGLPNSGRARKGGGTRRHEVFINPPKPAQIPGRGAFVPWGPKGPDFRDSSFPGRRRCQPAKSPFRWETSGPGGRRYKTVGKSERPLESRGRWFGTRIGSPIGRGGGGTKWGPGSSDFPGVVQGASKGKHPWDCLALVRFRQKRVGGRYGTGARSEKSQEERCYGRCGRRGGRPRPGEVGPKFSSIS